MSAQYAKVCVIFSLASFRISLELHSEIEWLDA